MNRGLLVLAWLVMASMGCTHNEDVGGGEFSFDLPEAIFSVASNPNDPRWRSPPPEGIPDVICRGPAALTEDCCNFPSPAGSPEATVSVDCQQHPLSCDAAGWCALAFDYSDQNTIDLGSSVPGLRQRRGWVLANADLPALETDINLPLGLPIESAALYVAPQGVLSPKSPASRFLATIPLQGDLQPKDPGQQNQVALGAEARFVLSTFLADFNTPFALILSARVAIEAPHTGPKTATPSSEEIKTATFTIRGGVRASF